MSPLEKLAENGTAYLRYEDLVRLGLYRNRETLRRHLDAGKFPRPIYREQNSPLWPIDEVIAWDQQARAARPMRQTAA